LAPRCQSVGQGECQGYVGLEGRGVVVLAVGLVTPVADGLGGSGCEKRISAECANGGDGSILGDVDFERDVAGAVSGDSVGGIRGFNAVDQTAFRLRRREPHDAR
jgi:hypothetical protein